MRCSHNRCDLFAAQRKYIGNFDSEVAYPRLGEWSPAKNESGQKQNESGQKQDEDEDEEQGPPLGLSSKSEIGSAHPESSVAAYITFNRASPDVVIAKEGARLTLQEALKLVQRYSVWENCHLELRRLKEGKVARVTML